MKNFKLNEKSLSTLMMMIMFAVASLSLSAQPATPPTPPPAPGDMHFLDRIPDLTQAQRDQVKKLHTAMLKEILPIQNQILEKEAHLRTLTTAEKTDTKAIDKTIDEISKLRGDIQKKRMKFMMDTRALLTEDQRVVFDQFRLRKMNGHRGQGFGQGRGNGNGCGYGRGRGQGPCRM